MKNKLQKKGFSLIELMAVLAVLAIIAVITVPNVLKVVNNSKTNTIKETTKLLAKAAQNYWKV